MQQQLGHDRRTDNGPDTEKALDQVHGAGMVRPGRRQIADQGQGAGFEDADGCAGDEQQADEKQKAVTGDEQTGGNTEHDQPGDDRRLAADTVGQEAKPQPREGNPRHAGIVESAPSCQTEMIGAHDLRDDDPGTVGRHREHHEHKIGQKAQ